MKIYKKLLKAVFFKKVSVSIFLYFIFFYSYSFLYPFPEVFNIESNYFIEKNKSIQIDSHQILFSYYDLYAKKVELKSDFDQWQRKYLFRKKSGIAWNGLWTLSLPLKDKEFHLKKGKYFYKILLDDIFTHDNKNPNKEKDGSGNYLSYFILKEDLIDFNQIKMNPIKDSEKDIYRFIYKGSVNSEIYLIGNFNNWNPYSHQLKHIGYGIWEIKLRLIPGKYYYNFIIDEKWKKDVLNPLVDSKYPDFSFFEIIHP